MIGQILPNNNETCYSNFSPTFREVNILTVYSASLTTSILDTCRPTLTLFSPTWWKYWVKFTNGPQAWQEVLSLFFNFENATFESLNLLKGVIRLQVSKYVLYIFRFLNFWLQIYIEIYMYCRLLVYTSSVLNYKSLWFFSYIHFTMYLDI
jgi:hypothetical protein